MSAVPGLMSSATSIFRRLAIICWDHSTGHHHLLAIQECGLPGLVGRPAGVVVVQPTCAGALPSFCRWSCLMFRNANSASAPIRIIPAATQYTWEEA